MRIRTYASSNLLGLVYQKWRNMETNMVAESIIFPLPN
jgi:hypothetical protein